jgi:hypothetical protein
VCIYLRLVACSDNADGIPARCAAAITLVLQTLQGGHGMLTMTENVHDMCVLHAHVVGCMAGWSLGGVQALSSGAAVARLTSI